MNPSSLSRIQTDIARIVKGDWFFPMTIKEINQHSLVAKALELGAEGFTYQIDQASLLPESSLQARNFSVPDLREHLFSLARERRPTLSAAAIAVIAGSAGKTSVKELVGAILQNHSAESSFMSPENQNTKIALATQVLRLPETCEKAVFEMGARRTGDFAVPLRYLQPSIVALLNIGTAHIGEFGSRESLWQEKLSCLNTESAKTLIVLGDDPRISDVAMATGKEVLTFGYADHCFVQILEERAHEILLKVDNSVVLIGCPFTASAKALNVAASVAVAFALKVPRENILQGISQFQGTPRRFQEFMWDQTPAIDDAFNASPESLYAGLKELRKISENKNVLLVLGSMLELDQETESAHRKVAHDVKDLFSESDSISLATVGHEAAFIADEWQKLGVSKSPAKIYASSEAATELRSLRQNFDLVYFKGSKSIQLQKIFGDL